MAIKKSLVVFVIFLSVFGLFYFNFAYGANNVIFSDGFEDGFTNWTSNDVKWTTSGTSSETGVHSGLRRGQATGNTEMEPGDDILVKNISTSGSQDIVLGFWYRIYKGLEDDDHVYIEWTSDGSNWIILQDFTDLADSPTWEFVSYNLPSEVNDKSSFAIRFRAHLGAVSSDIFYLDDVTFSGDTQNIQLTPVASPELSAEAGTPTPVPSGTPTVLPLAIPTQTLAPSPAVLGFPAPSPSTTPSVSKTSVPPAPVGTLTPTTTPIVLSATKISEEPSPSPSSEPEKIDEPSASNKNNIGSKIVWWSALLAVFSVVTRISISKRKRDKK